MYEVRDHSKLMSAEIFQAGVRESAGVGWSRRLRKFELMCSLPPTRSQSCDAKEAFLHGEGMVVVWCGDGKKM